MVARPERRGPSGAGVAWALAFALVASACADARAPEALVGRWTADDPRYEGRSLVVSSSTLELGQGGVRSEIFPIEDVESEEGVEGGTLHVLRYRNSEGDSRTLRVIVLPGSPPSLRFENHDERWVREGGPGGSSRGDT